MESINQNVPIGELGITLAIKREDLLHREISGNKFRKLKYNLIEARKKNYQQLLTFGGAFSNHISAVAAAGKIYGFSTIGIIRGEELSHCGMLNPTLQYAVSCGMQLKFISREAYRQKDDPTFVDALNSEFGAFYLLPEGGTNSLAIKGCEEILGPADLDFDYICCAVGTGGTIAGIINSSSDMQHVIGFPALKSGWLRDEIAELTRRENWELRLGYEFGGYGKVDADLIGFLNGFNRRTGIPLDPIYTGKMIFGVMDMIAKGKFPAGSKILAIHTGGLQGIKGMNDVLIKKQIPIIDYD